jgi:hypothetical protein
VKRASCIAWASVKTRTPKCSAALIFLWLLSLYQDKESNIAFWAKKKPAPIYRGTNTNLKLTFIMLYFKSAKLIKQREPKTKKVTRVWGSAP